MDYKRLYNKIIENRKQNIFKKQCFYCMEVFKTKREDILFCSKKCKLSHRKENPVVLTQEVRKIMSQKAKERAQNNPSTISKNTIWINNGKINKRVSNKNVMLDVGWSKGRLKRAPVYPPATNGSKG